MTENHSSCIKVSDSKICPFCYSKIRGWMTKINNPNDLSGGDLFGYEIKYTNPVYSSLTTGKYNGNIAEIDWRNSFDNV